MSPAGLLDRSAESTDRPDTHDSPQNAGWAVAPAPADPFDTLSAALPSGLSELPCRATEEDLWFSESPADLERAKVLCTECPLRRACLAGALERREYCGVWGGEIFDRGAVIARKKPRGRPSKADLARDAELAASRAAPGVA